MESARRNAGDVGAKGSRRPRCADREAQTFLARCAAQHDLAQLAAMLPREGDATTARDCFPRRAGRARDVRARDRALRSSSSDPAAGHGCAIPSRSSASRLEPTGDGVVRLFRRNALAAAAVYPVADDRAERGQNLVTAGKSSARSKPHSRSCPSTCGQTTVSSRSASAKTRSPDIARSSGVEWRRERETIYAAASGPSSPPAGRARTATWSNSPMARVSRRVRLCRGSTVTLASGSRGHRSDAGVRRPLDGHPYALASSRRWSRGQTASVSRRVGLCAARKAGRTDAGAIERSWRRRRFNGSSLGWQLGGSR